MMNFSHPLIYLDLCLWWIVKKLKLAYTKMCTSASIGGPQRFGLLLNFHDFEASLFSSVHGSLSMFSMLLVLEIIQVTHT
jgi:hypothetical protein